MTGGLGRLAAAALPARRPGREQVASFVLTAALVSALGVENGGYSPVAWGFGGLASLAVAALALTRRRPHLGRPAVLTLAMLVAVSCVTAVGAARPGLATLGIPELERDLLYAAVLWASLLVVDRPLVGAAVGGVLAGIVATVVTGLVMYLLDRQGSNTYEGRLLYEPVGYANGVGALAAIGTVLAVGVCARAAAEHARALAAAALVPLALAIYLSHSRGAAAALALGLAVAALLDGIRPLAGSLVLPALSPLTALALAAASRVDDPRAPAATWARDGRLLALALPALGGAAWLLCRRAGRPFAGSRPAVPALLVAVAGVAAAALAAPTGLLGAPRAAYWHAAWSDLAAHPLLGSGPGTFARVWLRLRHVPMPGVDAHNLFLETAAELGLVGLAALVVMLLVPLAAARVGVRRHRYGTYVVAAYVVFLAHAAVDWDWELPAITATGLVLAAVAIAAGRSDRLPPARNRPAALAATVTAAVLVAWGLAASTTFSSAVSAAEAGRWQTSRELALRSAWWAPWSAEPWFLVGETDLALHDPHAARSAFARAAARDGRDWRTWYEVARTSTGAERARAVSLIAEENPLAVRRRR